MLNTELARKVNGVEQCSNALTCHPGPISMTDGDIPLYIIAFFVIITLKVQKTILHHVQWRI